MRGAGHVARKRKQSNVYTVTWGSLMGRYHVETYA